MTLLVIPLQPVPNQTVAFPLNEASYSVEITTRRGNLYLTLWRSGEYLLRNRALKSYAPVGYGIIMTDTEGTEDPSYEGLGTRWLLMIDDAQAAA